MTSVGAPASGRDQSSLRDVVDGVRRVVDGSIAGPAGFVGIERAARTIGTSVRTLQRCLHAAGLTYAGVVQEARCAAARELLGDRARKIGDVARVLGYSDPAHFTRAFQRWTGHTPREFRERRDPRDRRRESRGRARPKAGTTADPI